MTTAIALARPDQVLRAAALLGGSADQLGTAVAACRRSADVRWVGRPNEQYQWQLADLAVRLTRLRTAFDAGCEELLSYARALRWAQPLAEEADRLEQVPLGEALLGRALELRAAATDAEAAAATRLVTALDALTDRAPHVSGLTRASHHAASFAMGLDDALHGVGATVLAAARSLPGVGSRASRTDARGEVVDSVEAGLQPWKQVQELYDALRDGHAWRTSGEVAGAALFRFRGARGHGIDFFGAHDELPDRVMLVLDRGARALDAAGYVDVWLAAHLRAEFVRALLRLEQMPLPTLDELDLRGVDLLHQEAGGGHTLQRHVGRDVDFLRDRQRWEPTRFGDPKAMSSFSTLDEAEALVTDAVRANLSEVKAFLADGRAKVLEVAHAAPPGTGLVIAADATVVPARSVVVRLVKANGTVRVQTAFLNP